MQLISVNIGKAQPIQNAKDSGMTGIYKIPTPLPVEVTPLGLVGDAIVDVENHGGEDQAVYVFGGSDYAWWSAELGVELEPGTFGENLTVSDLESAALQVGDRLQVGAVLLEITSPRIPCVTLAARMGDPTFVKKFRAGERPGVYCRVIQPGAVQESDSVSLIPYTGKTVSVIEMFRWFYEGKPTAERLRRLLEAPISVRDRGDYEKQLAELNL